MDLRKVHVRIDKVCPKSRHRDGHTILPIPGRDDVCFAFCKGWDNRLFLVWERAKKIHNELIGGIDGYQILVNEDTLVVKDDTVKIYCSVLNFIGASPGAEVVCKLGKYGKANPRVTISR